MPRKRTDVPYFRDICHAFIDCTEDLIYVLDAGGCCTFINPYMARFLSREVADIIGKPPEVFMSEIDAPEHSESVRRVFSGERSVKTEFSIRKGEDLFQFGASLIPLKNAKGKIYGVLAIARDITESRNFEKQLVATEKLASLGVLAAGLAHEINNPLSIMLGFCDLLLEKTDPESLNHRDLKTIERHGLYCKEVVENLLSFARITEEYEESADINHALEMVLGIMAHNLFTKGIKVEKTLAPSLPLAYGDTKQFQQVFLSIISNAMEAMEDGGTLRVSTSEGKASPLILVRISDTGTGIEGKYIDKIFDPFFTTKKGGKGTGLGLSVSYGIVSKYGGIISCDSRTGEKHGTTFTIKLKAFEGA